MVYHLFAVLQFSGSYYPKRCIKSNLPSLPGLEISKFTYTGNEPVGGLVAERWEFIIGARTPAESVIKTTWLSVYDPRLKAHRPARFVEMNSGSVLSKMSSTTEWNVGVFAEDSGGDPWFRVPGHCL